MKATRTFLAPLVLLLVGCSGSTVLVEVGQPAIDGVTAAPAAMSTGAASNDSDPAGTFEQVDEPEIGDAVPVAQDVQSDPVASASQTAENPEVSETIWCADLGLRIHYAEKATIDARYLRVGNLPEAVEDLHQLYRNAASARPAAIAQEIDAVNLALDVLEPILQPVDWDFAMIDRTSIDDTIDAYSASSMAIDEYNSATCGLERAGALPDDDPIEIPDPAESAPRPTPDPLRAPTDLEIDRFMNQVTGATRAEAVCFLTYRYGVQEGAAPSPALDQLVACGVSIDRLAALGLIGYIVTTSPADPLNENQQAAMVKQAEVNGMTSAEAACFVASYVGHVEGRLTPETSLEMLLGCGLTVERMAELGLPAGCPWRPNVCAPNN